MPVPNIFGAATTAIPLTQLDANFNTVATLGNASIGLGNTTTTVGNLTLTNVTITSGTINSAVGISGNVTIGNTTVGLGNTATSVGNLTLTNVTLSSGTSNMTLGNTAVTIGSATTSVGNLALTNVTITTIQEPSNVTATAATGTINMELLNTSILYLTSNATGNFTVNFRGTSTTSLNNVMSNNTSVACTVLATQGSTAYYNSVVQVDGNTVTPKWQGGTAPTSGNASSIDSYTYVIIKTGSAAFTVLAAQTKFA